MEASCATLDLVQGLGEGGDLLTPTWPTETNHPGILYLALSRVE